MSNLLVKLTWLIVDPYLFFGRLPRITERLLSELTFSMTYSIYATILYIWYSLTERIFKRKNQEIDPEETTALNQVVERYLGHKKPILEKQ